MIPMYRLWLLSLYRPWCLNRLLNLINHSPIQYVVHGERYQYLAAFHITSVPQSATLFYVPYCLLTTDISPIMCLSIIDYRLVTPIFTLPVGLLTHWPMGNVEVILQVCVHFSNPFYKLLSWALSWNCWAPKNPIDENSALILVLHSVHCASVLSGMKPLPMSMLIHLYVTMSFHLATIS